MPKQSGSTAAQRFRDERVTTFRRISRIELFAREVPNLPAWVETEPPLDDLMNRISGELSDYVSSFLRNGFKTTGVPPMRVNVVVAVLVHSVREGLVEALAEAFVSGMTWQELGFTSSSAVLVSTLHGTSAQL